MPVFCLILIDGCQLQDRTSGLGRFQNFHRIRPRLELGRKLVAAESRYRNGRNNRRLGVLNRTFSRLSTDILSFSDSRDPDCDERTGLLRHLTSVSRDDDDLVNVLPLEVEFLGQGQQTGLRVDVEMPVSVGLSPIDGVSHAAVVTLK